MRTVPRKAALQILNEVLANSRTLDEAIELACARGPATSTTDRAWLTEISSGVVRHLRRLDLTIDSYALKKKPTGKIRKILQIAVYQLLHQDRVFPATVVSETVDFIKAEEGEFPAKFANALLRKVAEARAEWREPRAPGPKASLDEKAAWASLPAWWWKKWETAHGYEKACAIATASLERPETWFRIRDSAKLPAFLTAGPVPGSARLNQELPEAGGIAQLPGFSEGQWIVQDLASQILATRFSEKLNSLKNRKILDRCAAPGGKSVALAWLGADVYAADSSDGRRKILEETVSRAAPAVKILRESEIETKAPYSAVWIDAPCSGSGILRRHPDVRWLRKEADLAGLIEIQRKLLQDAFALVEKSGIIFYSVCSLFAEEGRERVREWAHGHGSAVRIVEEIELGPHQEPSTDGFYGAILERI